MPIEWGALRLAFSVATQAGKLVKGPLFKGVGLDATSKALSKANEQFVSLFGKELEYREVLTTVMLPAYTAALELFCNQDGVQKELAAPLDGETPLDWRQLRAMWGEVKNPDGSNLATLPPEFDWENIGRKYAKAALAIAFESPELRAALDSRNIERTADATQRLSGPRPEFELEDYRRKLRGAYEVLKLGSIATDWDKYNSRLRSVYVPQTVREALPPRELTRDYRKLLEREQRLHGDFSEDDLVERRTGYEQTSTRDLIEAVDDPANRRLVILGDPGLGKSTLLQWLALRWAETGAGPVPFLVELRKYVGDVHPHKNVLDYFESGSWNFWRCSQADMIRHLKNEESLVMFDGLDEVVDPKRRAIVIEEIAWFGHHYPKARVIVTTRIVGYHPGSNHPQMFRDSGFRHFTLQDFEGREMESFITAWHKEAPFTSPGDREKYERRLRDAIAGSHAIRELAGNPLLLTMMAILSRRNVLPKERCLLYEECADLLLHDWDTEKFPEAADRIGPRQKLRMLQRVAYEMQAERSGLAGNLIPEEKLKSILRAQLAELSIPNVWEIAEDLVKKLHERSYMLSFLGDGQYGFVHRTFLEYCCAREYQFLLEKTSDFKVNDLRTLFRSRWEDDAWSEVLRLICGLVGSEYVAQVVRELLVIHEQSETRGRALLLAADCLSEVTELAKIVAARTSVSAALKSFTRVDFASDEITVREYVAATKAQSEAVEKIARGWKGDPDTVRWLKERVAGDANEDVRQAAVQELARGWKDDPDTVRWLKERVAGDAHWAVRQAAVQELTRGWKDDPDTVRLLKERVAGDANEYVRHAAVQELARGWKDDPDTVRLLKERVAGDANEYVRHAAVQELARGWKDDPDTVPLLKERVAGDANEDVRQAAVQELARGWKDDPDTVRWLKERVAGDANEDVRQAAVQELARGWKDDPDTVRWLKERVAGDAHWAVRQAAVQELARGWKDDPDTVRWLKERVAGDADEYVRQAAVQELARGWKDDPDTVRLLKERVAGDAHWAVRQAAVQELARGWKDDPDTVRLLKERVAGDEDGNVRLAAVQELARGWKDDPDTVRLLKERVAGDEDVNVRFAAVQELARGWKDDPDTVRLLKERVAGDEDEDVRQAAVLELNRLGIVIDDRRAKGARPPE